MSLSLSDALALSRTDVVKMTDDQFRLVLARALEAQQEDRKENQLLYYRPVSEQAVDFHRSQARFRCIGGGNGSGKSETSLAHLAMMMTGVISGQIDPETRKAVRSQFRGPVQCRIVLESLTTTMHPVIMPKLQWWRWNGYDAPGGERGHWGWIPKNCLVGGLWSRAWNEKTRLLRILCRDPDEPERILGESTLQIMAHNQEPSDFA